MDSPGMFMTFGVGAVLILAAGLYSIMVSKDLIRAVIGIEILAKATTLLVIAAGYFTRRIALAQTLVITVIVIEVAVTVVAVGMVLALYRREKSIDSAILRNLKG